VTPGNIWKKYRGIARKSPLAESTSYVVAGVLRLWQPITNTDVSVKPDRGLISSAGEKGWPSGETYETGRAVIRDIAPSKLGDRPSRNKSRLQIVLTGNLNKMVQTVGPLNTAKTEK